MDHDLSLSKLRPAEPRGSIYVDEYLTEESGDEGDSPRLVAKKIKKLGYRKKKYKVITNKMREELIDAIENKNEKIKDAAKRLRMNYSSAKSILQVYKKEGRCNKKGFRRKSVCKNEFSEDEEEFSEKLEFIKEESSATISRKEIVPVEESEDEVLPPQKPQKALEAKVVQLTPKQTTPEKQVSPKALQENIKPISLFQQQQQQQQPQFNYSLNNTNLTPLSFFPSAASSLKTNFATNSYFQPNSFSSMPFPGINFQGAFPTTNPLPKDNLIFKTANLGGLQQKPAQRNLNSLSGTHLSQDNPVFMQNLIQTNFFPSQYIAAAAGNRYWNPLLVGSNPLIRPTSNQLVGNFGVHPEIHLPKVEDFDI